MTPDQIARTVRSSRSHVRWISLSGGEVTDRPDFVEIVRRVVAEASPRLGMLNVTSNGLEPDRTAAVFEEVARITRGRPLYVTVSLDVDREAYRASRGVDGYDRARESLAILRRIAARERHVVAGCQILLSPVNARQAGTLPRTLGDGLRGMTLGVATDSYLLTRGRLDVALRQGSPDIDRAVEELWDAYRVRGLLDVPPKLYLGLLRRFLATSRSPVPCVAGDGVLTIDPYGNLLQCFQRKEPLARLADHGFDIPLACRSDAFQAALAPLRSCRTCWAPCQAYPSMMHAPFRSLIEYGRALAGR